MLASIITPTFNGAHFIMGCVENVAQQGSVVLEHIIADGGSTDGTLEIVRELQLKYPWLRLLPGPDRGQSDAMNKATALSKGDVIGILNVDDFYEPGAIARGVARLARETGPTLVCGDCRVIDEHGQTVYINRPRDLRIVALLQDLWLFPYPVNPSAYFYTRDVHDIVGGYDIDDSYAMDCEFLLSCAERVRMIYVAELWGNFRYIPGAKTFEDKKNGPARVNSIISRHKQRLSLAQQLYMKALRTQRKTEIKAGRVLQRLGLRKSG